MCCSFCNQLVSVAEGIGPDEPLLERRRRRRRSLARRAMPASSNAVSTRPGQFVVPRSRRSVSAAFWPRRAASMAAVSAGSTRQCIRRPAVEEGSRRSVPAARAIRFRRRSARPFRAMRHPPAYPPLPTHWSWSRPTNAPHRGRVQRGVEARRHAPAHQMRQLLERNAVRRFCGGRRVTQPPGRDIDTVMQTGLSLCGGQRDRSGPRHPCGSRGAGPRHLPSPQNLGYLGAKRPPSDQ